MNARDEARRVIHTAHCLEVVHNDDCMFWEDDATSADALLAAGYRKPRTITTTEELDALPLESVVKSAEGDVWEFLVGGWFETASRLGHVASDLALPATVLYEPEAAA